jgi:hypothetical protein
MKEVISRNCNTCGIEFVLTYYNKVDYSEIPKTCTRCWNKSLTQYYTSTRDNIPMVSRPNPYVSKSLVNKQIVNKGYLAKTTPVSKKEELPKNLELAVRDLLAAIG